MAFRRVKADEDVERVTNLHWSTRHSANPTQIATPYRRLVRATTPHGCTARPEAATAASAAA
jgi:hypothetical protein